MFKEVTVFSLEKALDLNQSAQSFCLILAQVTHTMKTQLSPLRTKDEEHKKRL